MGSNLNVLLQLINYLFQGMLNTFVMYKSIGVVKHISLSNFIGELKQKMVKTAFKF